MSEEEYFFYTNINLKFSILKVISTLIFHVKRVATDTFYERI